MQHGSGHAQAGAWAAAPTPRINEVQHKRTKTGGTLTTTKYAPPPGYLHPVAQAPAYTAWPYAAPGYHPQQGYPGGYAQAAAYNAYAAQCAQYYQQQAYYAQAAQATQQGFLPTSYQHQDSQTTFDPAAYARSSSVLSSGTEAKQNGPNDDLDENDDEYCEFTRPCYYASRESEIVKELSIGIVHAKTAAPANTALPATWMAANEIALVQSVSERHDASRCISAYHTDGTESAELVSVRDTNLWDDVRGDLIFKHFPITAAVLIARTDLLRRYRNRIDREWADAKPDLKRSRLEMQGVDSCSVNKKRIFSQTDAANETESHGKRHRQGDGSTRPIPLKHSVPSKQAVPAKLPTSLNQSTPSQEEVLARLGVTGAPKPMSAAHPMTPQEINLSNVVSGAIREPTVDADDQGVADDQSEQMELDSGESTPRPSPKEQNTTESRWTRLAREYQKEQKRSYDQSDFDHQDKDPSAVHHQKRRR